MLAQTREISSITIAYATVSIPEPPCSVGTATPASPSSPAAAKRSRGKLAALVDGGRARADDALGELADRGLEELLLLREVADSLEAEYIGQRRLTNSDQGVRVVRPEQAAAAAAWRPGA